MEQVDEAQHCHRLFRRERIALPLWIRSRSRRRDPRDYGRDYCSGFRLALLSRGFDRRSNCSGFRLL